LINLSINYTLGMETDVYHVYFDESNGLVTMQWKGYATSQQFREGTELMLDALTRNNSSRVLADIREMVLIGQEDQHWLENNFLPRAITSGFKKIAIVRPESYFNKVAVENISYNVDKEKLMIHFFDNTADAIQWLNRN